MVFFYLRKNITVYTDPGKYGFTIRNNVIDVDKKAEEMLYELFR